MFLSTGLTRYVADPVHSVRASMKGAIEVCTKYAAKVLGSRRVTVTALAPGATVTNVGGGTIRDDGYRTMLLRSHAAGRVGAPADIGGAVLAVTSESAGRITAQRVEACGGQSPWPPRVPGHPGRGPTV